jgi:hypothetical protein
MLATNRWLRHRFICGRLTAVNRKSGRIRFLLVAFASMLGVSIVVSFLTFIGIPAGLRPHVYWLLWSRQYKRDVLSSPGASAELSHAEWDGDGWGGAPVGDWMGYVVYDPSDALPRTDTNEPPIRIAGIPCDVVAVRRLEKCWYSVVTDMNQFWDRGHPHCQAAFAPAVDSR